MDFNTNYTKELFAVNCDVASATKDTHARLLSETQEQAMPRSSANNRAGNDSLAIQQEGCISSAQLSGAWNSTHENLAIRSLTRMHPAGDESVTISMIQPRIAINAASGQAFHDLLERYPNQTHTLDSGEIKSVEKVLNTLNVGDNQHTNSARPGDPYAPNFHLSSSRVEEINGRPVLEVEGSFVNQMGNATNLFKGIFIDRDSTTGTAIQGIALEAPDQQRYSQYSTAFENMLKSIRWGDR